MCYHLDQAVILLITEPTFNKPLINLFTTGITPETNTYLPVKNSCCSMITPNVNLKCETNVYLRPLWNLTNLQWLYTL